MSQLQGSSPSEDGRDEPPQMHARNDEQRALIDKQRDLSSAPAGVEVGDAASTLSSSPREPPNTSSLRDGKRTSSSSAITAELPNVESTRAAAATEPPATHDAGDEIMSAAAKAAAPCASSSPTSKTTTATRMDEAADAAAFATGIAAASAAPQPAKAASQLDESSSASASPAPASQTNTTTAEAAVKRWKENKEYLKLQRDMGRVLASMDRTPVADWATQASLLAQLQRIVQGAKDIVGAVELPDGDRFARSLWRAMSPQTVVGVQRKALEVLQSYLEYVNPAYPMTKDLPHFLPALLELLPQATMQVKSDVLELLDCAVVRRMPPIALRSCAEGLLAALLSCLEESETSAMYRRAMALLEYVHNTLQCDTSLDQRAGVLRGGQVLPAYTWLLVRDAASVRCPALLVMKRLIAQASLPAGEKAAVTRHSDETGGEEEERKEDALLSSPEQHAVPVSTTLPDWVGGDVQVVVSGLFNSLQDTQEKVHRLALDVLALVCPLGGRGGADAGGGSGAATQTAVAAACLYESSVGISPAPSPTSSGPLTLPPPDSWATSSGGAAGGADFPAAAAQAELFSFEMKALLAAAAVQLLGTRHSTPSVTRRILQWLTVDPGCEAGERSGQWGGAAEDVATAGDDASPSSSSHSYVRDVTSFLLAQGFHMVVRHWQASWTNRFAEGGAAGSRTPIAQRHLSSELSALQRTARSLVGAAAPRLSSATSIAAALSGGVGGGMTAAAAAGGEATTVTSSATSTAVGAVATPLVWLRALMLLFRYRSPSSGGAAAQAADAGAGASPNTLDSPRHTVSDGASEPDTSSPFALYLVPLVLPSLSCLLEDVPSVLSRASLDSVKDARVPGSGKGINGSPEEEAWCAEVRALLRVLPWTGFAKLDVLGVQAVEKLVRPLLAETSRDGGNGGGVEPLQRRIQQYLHEAFTLVRALEPSLMDATTEQPVAAQEYVGASLAWSDTVASLLSDVLDALTHAVTSRSVQEGLYISLFVSTANGLLRVVVQRMQQLMEPMFDAVLATANATATAVVGADFFASFVSAVDSGVLRRLREATVRTTQGLLFAPHSDSGTPVDNTSRSALHSLPDDQRAEVQKLLSRMHHTTLRFTAFLAQLHLRCQQHAVAGMLLDSASEDGAGSRERELARETASWLRCLCRACAAAACNASLFFTRAVRLVLDVLLRARGSLLPAATYHMLEPNCLASGGLNDTVAFAEKFVLAPVVRSLWEGCRSVRDTAATAFLAQSSFASAEDCCADTAGVCGASLLVLIAVSPACARCLDVCILESSVDAAIPRLVGLHRQLVDLRAQQRRGHVSSAAVPESAVVAELQDPGVLFLGLLTLLSCVSVGSGGSDRDGAAESTRQLARAYLSHATVRDLSSVLLPLFFSFLCPLVLPIPPVTASMETGAGGATPHYASAGPAFSALTLTVLLPSSTHPGTKVRCADEAQRPEAARTYRTLEAAELVHHIFALLQLPTALAWLRQAMRTPTPNSLRVLLRGLEAQSFMAPDGRTSATAAALAREGPSDSLLAATALLLLNLSRQSLLSLHWSVVHRRDQAGGAGGGGVRGGIASASSGLGSPTHAEFPPSRHHSILLDALGCLNRMLEGSQTGPRTQPCRTAQHTWQFTAMQLLPLLRLAVQANLHTAQAMLLDHITGVVVYVDDVMASSSSSSGASATATVFGAPCLTAGGGGESGVTSRHWHPHALLRIGAAAAGHPDDALLLSGAPASEAHGSAATATTTTAAWVGESERTGGCGTPVTDDLQRAPPAVLSNKLLYAMIGEAVEHALGALCGTEEAAAATADREVDTLVRWLRFYCDVLPYLYRELVPSSEVVLDVLLSALETTAPPCVPSSPSTAAEAAASAPRLPAALARVRCVCYATLAFLLRFLFSVARAADVEDYEAAVKAKEAMSWIASTFSQEDPVARARSTTMWSRSPVLAPLRGALGRLVSAAVPGLCLGHTIHAPATNCTQSGPGHASAQPFTWGYDADAEEEVAMGWRDGPRSPQPPPAGPTEERREPARQLLILLSHSAGPQFVTAFVEHWCGAHASSTALWVFETAGQRQCRLRQVQRSRGHHCSRGEEDEEVRRTAVHEGSAGANAAMTAEVVRLRSAAWAAREVAQRAAGALLDDVGLSVAEVAMALGSLLREAIPKQLRSEQQSAQKSEEGSATRAGRGGGEGALTSLSTSLPPSHVAQVLYFLDTLVESVCTARPGGLTDRDAEAILALTSEVVSQGPPDSLAVCCVFHTVYCVIAYARGETGGTESERSNAVRGLSSSSPSPRTAASASKIYQSKDYSFTLCRLLEALSLNPAATHRSATLMLLQLLCQCFHAVLPSSLSWTDNPGRLVDAVTRVFQRTLLPTLRRGIASESEAEIVSNAPLVNACLRVLRAAINGFAPDQSFEKRVHRDIVTLVFSEHFFRYSRGSLHEWARLLRQLCAMDGDFHALMCERLVPSAGRLSTLMMSRETEALLRERALKCLAFYTYAVTATEDSPATSGATAASTGVATVVAAAAADNAGLGPAVSVVRHKELIHVLREQLTHTLQHFSPTTTPTVAEVDRKEVFVQPLRAAFFVFRVLLLCGIRESLAASLWPLVWPELLRALAIKPLPAVDSARSESAAVSVDAVQEVLRLQVEALKVLDADYTLYPAHAFSFRWLFTDDTALASVVALQQQQRYCRSRAVKKGVPHTPSPMSALLRAAVVRRVPLVSHLEVLHLLQKSPPVAAELHFDPTSLIAAVHEPRVDPPCDEGSSEGLAPVLATIQRCWPLSARPSAGDRGLRRPLFNLPSTHYARLDGVHRAAQAFSVLLQRVNGEALSGDEDVQRLMLAQRELGECVGFHNEVDVAFMQDLVEADLTMTDSDTML